MDAITVIGTRPYMAPEIINSKRYGLKVSLFATVGGYLVSSCYSLLNDIQRASFCLEIEAVTPSLNKGK